MEKKLQVHSVRISFRTVSGKLQAVRDVSFDLHKGETLAIVGESGSGKSVTSKAILGILAGNAIIEGGEILYDGQDLLKISEDDFYKIRGDKISMIFQDPLSSLNPIMRIGKQLTEAMLRNLGANDKQIVRVFLFEGRMISAIGAVVGILVGLLLCWLQQEYGLVGLGQSSGSFVVDAYPVSVHPDDIVVIFLTVIAVGWLAVWYPVRYFAKRLL